MTQLCELVDEYGDELEWDFTVIYQLDIVDVFRGVMTRRRFLKLAELLAFEPRSLYRAAALGGFEHLGFDRLSSQIADLHDALNANTVVTAKTGGAKPRTPDPYPRPVARKDDPKTVDVPTIDDFPIHLVVGLTTGK